jgi:hypothetical protein
MMAKVAPPSIVCEDFALIPRGANEGKPKVVFSRPVNLLSAASANGAASAGQSAAHVLVLNLDGQLYVRDLTGSASLQWKGQPTAQAKLENHDKIRLGKIEYEVFATRFATAGNSTPAAPVAELVPVSGGASRRIKPPVSLIGSSAQAELRIASPNVPEAMAMILRIGQGYWLWNLEAAFACRVNNQAVVRAALAEGSIISIAGQEFRFHLSLEASAPTAPAEKAPARTAAKAPVARRKPASKKPPAAAPPATSAPIVPATLPPSPVAPAPARVVQPRATSIVATPVAAAPPAPPPPPAVTAPQVEKVVATAPVPATPTVIDRRASNSELEDDADVFKQWGPLAFAVAAADRPELQAGGSKSGSKSPAAAAPAPRGRRWLGKVIVALFVLGVLAAGAFFVWKYVLKAPRV